jgi:hypothetical protein
MAWWADLRVAPIETAKELWQSSLVHGAPKVRNGFDPHGLNLPSAATRLAVADTAPPRSK